MTVAALVAAALAATVSLWRWLRVSQREHYLSGSIVVSARRWLRRRPPNAAAAVLWVGLGAASLGLAAPAPVGSASAGILGAALGALAPVGMAVVGTPRLRLTRRAAFQAASAAALTAVAIAVVAVVVGAGPAAALAPLVAGVAVDIAASLNRPLERRIAAGYRRAADAKLRRTSPRVIAITGSYGKTTVKNHVRDLVGAAFDTLATPASWNNLAGLSRAVNEHLTPTTEVFVAEMGTYGPGEIREMVEWLRPEIAVITAVGPVHLERMGTIETIVAAKREILLGARTAVLCVDGDLLRGVADDLRRRGSPEVLWTAGSDPSQTDLDVLVCPSPHPETTGVDAGMLSVWIRGEHLGDVPRDSLHPSNVACAVAAALAVGVDRRVLRSALGRLTATPSRAVAATSENGVHVVDDTFNSNPEGASTALETLQRMVVDGRRVVVTPGIVEMGHLQDEANTHFAAQVAVSGADLVVVGWTNRAALVAGHPGAVAVRDRAAASRWVRDHLARGDGVLWENDLPDHYP